MWEIKLSTDGKEVVRREKGRTLHCRLYWDKNELVFDTRIIKQDQEATNLVRYQLSTDGKQLTATERFRSAELQYDNLWILDKVDAI